MVMDTSVRSTAGESWPYNLASSGCTAGARFSGSTEHIDIIYPHWVPTFRRGTCLRRTAPDTEAPGSIPGDGPSVYPVDRLWALRV
jgi:hypothetical protein